MPTIQEQVNLARQLVKAFKHPEAEKILSLGLQTVPDDPDLNCELGLIYCLSQREFQALPLLDKSKGAEREALLGQTLQDYFTCRKAMATKLGVDDKKGAESLRHLKGIKPGKVGVTLSACLIVKNEEANLDRCLKSVKEVADEIVVIDTGSTDRTLEIAKKHGAKIGHFDWCDDFAAARNESLKLATGAWALWIDADEELTKESVNAIREGLIRPQFGGYFIKIVNFMDEDGDANKYVHTPVRLFQRLPGIQFTGRIHEQVLPSFERLGLVPATLSNAIINHYGYRASVMHEKDKLNRTIGMLEKEVRENPKDPFHWFNLANAYSVGRRHTDAERAARLSIHFIEPEAPYGPVVYQILSSALIATDRAEEALEVCKAADKVGFGSIVNEFDRAHALYKLRKFTDALEVIDRCLKTEWPDDLTGDYGIVTHKGNVLKAQILTELGRLHDAVSLLNLALAVDPQFGFGLYAKAVALERLGMLAEACDYYLLASDQVGMESCRILAGNCALASGNAQLAAAVFESAFEKDPSEKHAYVGWILASERWGDLPTLLRAFETIESKASLTSEMYVNWGRALERSGDFEKALDSFAKAIDKDPKSVNAYFNCGDLLYKLGQYDSAATQYEAALRLQPLSAQGWFVMGNCLAQMNLIDGAKIAYRQTLGINPRHAEARANLAMIEEESEAQVQAA